MAANPIITQRPGLRWASAIAALALILTLFVMVQAPAEAAPGGGAVASVSLPSIGDGAAQIDFRQIVCPILLAIRNAFANSPFFVFVQPIIDQLLRAFGCTPSG